MALPQGVVGATHASILATCQREDGSIVDLTGATMSGVIKNKRTGDKKNIVGTFALVDATGGQFRWTFATGDLDTVGHFTVQFTATFSDATLERSLLEDWEVVEAL